MYEPWDRPPHSLGEGLYRAYRLLVGLIGWVATLIAAVAIASVVAHIYCA